MWFEDYYSCYTLFTWSLINYKIRFGWRKSESPFRTEVLGPVWKIYVAVQWPKILVCEIPRAYLLMITTMATKLKCMKVSN